MDRRSFLRSTALAVGVTALGPSFWQRAYAATAQPGAGPYGPLLPPDANGVMLPAGFSSRILAVSGQPVSGTTYVWHGQPDGGAVFPQPDGGWVYTSNSEIPGVPAGGAGALRFGADGEVADAYRILSGTTMNCAGGPSPWGTWLSCEETPVGQVWECDVSGTGQGVALPALGRFQHEAVTFDDARGQLYLTEDRPDGRFYRFTPTAYPDLSAGALEALAVDSDDAAGRVSWVPVLSQDLPQEVAGRPPGTKAFDGGEGVWFDSDHVYFTNKGDNRVWDLDIPAQRLTVLYDAASLGEDAPLTGVDNIVVSQSADIFVAEDGGNLEIVLITPDQVVAPVMRLVGHDRSEICGPAFSPDGSRMYFSSQRGTDLRGITFEMSGPFRTTRTGPPARGTVPPPGTPGPGTDDGDAGTGGDPAGGDESGPGMAPSPAASPGPAAGPAPTVAVGSSRAQALPATGGAGPAAAAAAALAAGAAGAAYVTRRAEPDEG